ncbi:DNA mismatch repair protein MutS [Elusimicrobium posterum]|uniref:DNA mismatch repair protein MutS n=1 Tax=Elusimicrobium posterum TaxID=3116653 RepID=UPI003C76E6BF
MQEKQVTPAMKQYYDLKAQHPDLIIFFRMGDFYEMFDSDAAKASKILGITLTARAGTPMCGVPHHSAAGYIQKLIKNGQKVGVCEQVGVTMQGKTKLFERKLVRIITPGTVLEENILDSNASNYLVCVFTQNKGWAAAAIDVSTGEFWATQQNDDASLNLLASALAALNPAELLTDGVSLDRINSCMILPQSLPVTHIRRNESTQVPASWPASSGWGAKRAALSCALTILDYVNVNEPAFQDMLIPFYKDITEFMQLDENAVRTLELLRSAAGHKKGSLLSLIDFTKTPMGSRKLKNWLLNPLLNLDKILLRQQFLEKFYNNAEPALELREILSNISDIERILSRIGTGNATPRDLAGLGRSLEMYEELKGWALKHSHVFGSAAQNIQEKYAAAGELGALLKRAVVEAPPLKISDGGIIKEGYNAELDGLRSLQKNGNKSLQELAEREKEKTGIPTLKVGYNSIFGYYIEVSKGQAGKVPFNYTRKQTLANAERFITEELKNLEENILNAEQKILKLEAEIFQELRAEVSKHIDLLRAFASNVARLDVYSALALCAKTYNFVKPVVDDSNILEAKSLRHPVVESLLPPGSYVPNDLNVGGETQIEIITGPNMGGKSVYLKQSAILVLLAQMGSFVPAASARVGIIDKIMTRIGAQDALSKGESTFMVEMKETSHILACATPKSLVLLDEVGRGTSTFDGISIAWAITEFLYKPRGGAKVLFATHYFELTDLENKYSGIKNYHVEVKEYKDADGQSKIAFLYQIKEGPADQSYGIHVAELAGLPASCVIRAKKVIKDLEAKKGAKVSKKEEDMVADLFSSPIVEEIKLVDPQAITPMQALQMIEQWKKRIEE